MSLDSPARLPRLAPRAPDSHKGTFGHALIIGGSRGMAGAVGLASMSCLRSGAGLVTAATSSAVQASVAGFEPSLMTVPLPHDDAGRIVPVAMSVLAEHLEKATAIGLGPGLGQSDALTELVGQLYQTVKQPMVVDADALNVLSKQPAILPHAAGPRVFTPHPGEFARLTGRDKIPLDQRETLARDFAHRNGIVLVLKGHRTVITDGTQLALNATGNPGMATGGTGDVLTGLITSLLCQQLAPYDAARLGCHVHGLAGDLAADELGQISLIASDLVKYLPMAWQLTQTGEA
jgi:NAD(P)H-hydrate epimerase